jgi:hypothetical protein
MHGGAPAGRDRQHIVIAVFDASTGARIASHRIEWFPSQRLTVGLG